MIGMVKSQISLDTSYPKLSVWASILNPKRFKPYANNELSSGIKYLFKLDDSFPKRGFKAFQFAIGKIIDLEEAVRLDERLNALFKA